MTGSPHVRASRPILSRAGATFNEEGIFRHYKSWMFDFENRRRWLTAIRPQEETIG